MRPWLLVPAVVLCVCPPAALAQTGGASPPEGGGAEYGASGARPERSERPRRTRRPLQATEFTVDPGTVQPGGPPAKLAFRVDGTARRVRVRIDIVRAGEGIVAKRIRLGWKPVGVRRVHRWRLLEGALPVGSYEARLHAVDDSGRTLVRTARTSGRSPVHVTTKPVTLRIGSGVFPIRGPFSYGGDDARFGADRGTHSHQGQDLMAAEGTPVVTPRAGFVYWKAYQASGAGHYVVIRGDDGRDYVFMHLVSGSIPVGKEDPVQAGQQIGQVGNTGRSNGAHLHFEIWPNGWYAKNSQPIDPRPELDAWAASSAPAAPTG